MDGWDEEGGGLACWYSVICGGLGRIKSLLWFKFEEGSLFFSSLSGVDRSVESFLAK